MAPPKENEADEVRCCLDVVMGMGRDDEGRVCRSLPYLRTIDDGPSAEQYDKFKMRIKDGPPPTFADCNNKQKRLILYAALHRMLYPQGGAKGQRDPIPECLKTALRVTYPDPAPLSVVEPNTGQGGRRGETTVSGGKM